MATVVHLAKSQGFRQQRICLYDKNIFIHTICHAGNSSKGANSQSAMEPQRDESTFTVFVILINFPSSNL